MRDEKRESQSVCQVRSKDADWHFFLIFFFLGYEDDKVQLPFTVTDLKGRNLQLVTGPHNGQVGVGACDCKVNGEHVWK